MQPFNAVLLHNSLPTADCCSESVLYLFYIFILIFNSLENETKAKTEAAKAETEAAKETERMRLQPKLKKIIN